MGKRGRGGYAGCAIWVRVRVSRSTVSRATPHEDEICRLDVRVGDTGYSSQRGDGSRKRSRS